MFTFIENLFTLKTKAGLRAGFFFVCYLAGLGMILSLLRTYLHVKMPTYAPFTIGTELMALIISVIIYYSCIRGSKEVEEHTARFAILLSTSSFGVFLDQIAWLGMLEALNRDPQTSPHELLANVREAVDLFTGPEEQFDDLTMLCLEYKGGRRQ